MSDTKKETYTLTMSRDAWAALCVAIEDAASDEGQPLYRDFKEAAEAVNRFYTNGEGSTEYDIDEMGFMSVIPQ